jgi:Uncharacterized conserved protein
MSRRLSHVIGFDDAPFAPEHRGDVLIVGAVYAGLRLEGVVSGRVRRDGTNATRSLERIVSASRFAAHLQCIMLQGIAFAGFNVIDLNRLYRALGIPVLAIARKAPDMPAIKAALLNRVPGGARKWALIERLGEMDAVDRLWVQRVGLGRAEACALLTVLCVHSALPEPIRTAHLIAGGIAIGHSRGRA